MFLTKKSAEKLLEQFGSPLYVYDEETLRERCRELRAAFPDDLFDIDYSTKANSNPALLHIVREEGLQVDAMSPGEIHLEQLAGFPPEHIFFICNNVSPEEMRFAASRGILVSVDSVSQLELFGRTVPGGRVAVRFNSGVGDGHSEKVVTAGKKTKFGVQPECIAEVKAILKKYSLTLAAVNHHIGSLFLEDSKYVAAAGRLLAIAEQFPGLSFIDLGGGFGVPYRKEEGRLDLAGVRKHLDPLLRSFRGRYGNKAVHFRVEPGRYVAAECGVLLGRVWSVKTNYGVTYAGTDIGMNVLARPVLYNSYHEITVLGKEDAAERRPVTVVGNICESGDILARDRLLPPMAEGDIVAVGNAGAYGLTMSSNYNCRLRPAEVLLERDGGFRLIRRRDTLEDLERPFISG